MNLEPNPDQRGKMVKDAIDSLTPSFKPMLPSDGETLLLRAKDVSRRAGKIARELDRLATASGIPHDKKVLASTIGKAYLEGFGMWTKDELLYLLAFIHTDLAIDSMTGATDTKHHFKL